MLPIALVVILSALILVIIPVASFWLIDFREGRGKIFWLQMVSLCMPPLVIGVYVYLTYCR